MVSVVMASVDDDQAFSLWGRWILERWRPLVVAAIGVPLAIVAVWSSLYWPYKVFPGLFLLDNGLVPTVGLYSWNAPEHVGFHSRVLSANGNPIRSPGDLYRIAAQAAESSTIQIEIEKDGVRSLATISAMRFSWRDYWLVLGVFVVNGLLVLAVGVAVNLLQPDTREARVFLVFSAVSSMIMLTAPPIYHPDLSWLVPLNLLAYAFWGASFIHFGLVFPGERRFIASNPACPIALYGVSGLLTLWQWRDFYADPPQLLPTYLAMIYVAVGIVTMTLLFLVSYRQDRDPVTRAHLRLILPAFVLSTAGTLWVFLDNARGGGDVPTNLIAFGPAIFYLAVAYSIVRHDLFAIDWVVRQAAVYASLTAGIAAGYGLLTAAVPAWQLLGPSSSPIVSVAFFVAVAVLFEPARRRLQDWVDRVFFRAQVDYRHAVREVSSLLASVLDLEKILERVAATLDSGLAPDALQVVLWLDPVAPGTRRWSRDASGRLREEGAAKTSELRSYLSSNDLGSWAIQRERNDAPSVGPARSEAAALGAALIVPLRLPSRVLGVFALGRKRSRLPYSSEERELLETLAAQSAVAIHNSLLFEEVRKLAEELESKVHVRTGELERANADLERSHAELSQAYRDLQDAEVQLVQTEKLASLGQLVAGVAHEINTPVTAIVGNVRPLSAEMARLRECASAHPDPTLYDVASRMEAILEVMARGADRTAGIVQALRVYSRIGEDRPLPVDLHEGIEVSLRLLRPRWADRIEIHREYAELPLVTLKAGPINQVFMNILTNACDAIEGKGNIWIQTARAQADVVVTVRDDGCGMRPEDRQRIFDPFFTTKPVGKGTGLGLAVCLGIVRDHGGAIEVGGELGEGSVFKVILPLLQPEVVVGRAMLG